MSFLKYHKALFFCAVILFSGLCTNEARAANVCKDANIKIVPKDIAGNIIPGIKFEMFKLIRTISGNFSYGDKVGSGTVDKSGVGKLVLKVGSYVKDKNGYEVLKKTSEEGYALKLYDKNANVGEYWDYFGWKFNCGEEAEIDRTLSALVITLRDAQGNLLKNQSFSIYRQGTDADGKPIKIKKELVTTLTTGDAGEAKLYLAYDHPNDKTKKGIYVFNSKSSQGFTYEVYDIQMTQNVNRAFDYTFGSTLFELRNGNNEPIINKPIEFYYQKKDLKGRTVLDKKFYSGKTNDKGEFRLDHPAKTVAAVIKDNTNKTITFFGNSIPDRKLAIKRLKTNLIRVTVKMDATNSMPAGTGIKIKSFVTDSKGYFHPDKLVASGALKNNFEADFILVPGNYLIFFSKDGKDYGRAYRIEDRKYYQIGLNIDSKYVIAKDTKFSRSNFELEKYIANKPAQEVNKMAGKIVTLDDKKTGLWYIDVDLGGKYLLKDGPTAIRIFKRLGLYITSEDLAKLPFYATNTAKLIDTDNDGLNDELEKYFMTSSTNADTDADTHRDSTEIYFGYDPNGPGTVEKDDKLAKDLNGKILIVGDATSSIWYENPTDGRVHFLTQGKNIMDQLRTLAVKIARKDLDNIKAGTAKY